MRDEIDFVIDKNLNLPIDEAIWQHFFQKFHVTPSLYTDMNLLTKKMEENKTLLSYLPTGNFFYFRNDPFYTPIANALFSTTNSSKMDCLLLVSKNSPINTIEELKGKVYGYIHPYCTSSYFSMVWFLWKKGFSIHHFFSSMKEIDPWQPQIDAVISGEIDATAVPENVWYQLPSNGKNTKIIARIPDLPSPLIVVGNSINPNLLSELKNLLFNFKTPLLQNQLFNGFVPFQKEQTEKFFSDVAQALDL